MKRKLPSWRGYQIHCFQQGLIDLIIFRMTEGIGKQILKGFPKKKIKFTSATPFTQSYGRTKRKTKNRS